MNNILFFAFLASTLVCFSNSSFALEDSYAPAFLSPQAQPPPEPVPVGSESVSIFSPSSQANFNIKFNRGEGRDFAYMVSVRVNGAAFAKGLDVERIYVNIFDKTYNRYISDWTLISEREKSPLRKSFLLKFTLDKFSAPTYIIDRQKEMVLTFAINDPEEPTLPIRSLEIDRYCKITAHAFIDLRTGAAGCPK